jgi:predicted Zn-dependent protease
VARLEQLQALLARGPDSALLRVALATEMNALGDLAGAVENAAQAVRMQPDYSAAWKLLGKLQDKSGNTEQAVEAYSRGIEVAEARGDKQAAKEMRVFLKRLQGNT